MPISLFCSQATAHNGVRPVKPRDGNGCQKRRNATEQACHLGPPPWPGHLFELLFSHKHAKFPAGIVSFNDLIESDLNHISLRHVNDDPGVLLLLRKFIAHFSMLWYVWKATWIKTWSERKRVSIILHYGTRTSAISTWLLNLYFNWHLSPAESAC